MVCLLILKASITEKKSSMDMTGSCFIPLIVHKLNVPFFKIGEQSRLPLERRASN